MKCSSGGCPNTFTSMEFDTDISLFTIIVSLCQARTIRTVTLKQMEILSQWKVVTHSICQRKVSFKVKLHMEVGWGDLQQCISCSAESVSCLLLQFLASTLKVSSHNPGKMLRVDVLARIQKCPSGEFNLGLTSNVHGQGPLDKLDLQFLRISFWKGG